MSHEETITSAIGSHGLWKSRLADAVATGRSDFDPDEVRPDNRCEFGQWLHHDLDSAHKVDDYFKDALSMHANFHRLASEILREATTGNQSKAAKMITRDSEYGKLSVELTLALMAWRKEFAAAT